MAPLILGHFNGSIVANKGFIQQFAPPGTLILDAKWVSIWGGMQSTMQCLAQIACVFVTDRFGRRLALWLTWVLLCGVSSGVYRADIVYLC